LNTEPNILLLVIDGFRADKIHGDTKTSVTPNIDSLIKNGALFSQAISVSDGTRTCVGSIFTAEYPFQSGLTTFHNHVKSTKFLNTFKNNAYSLHATVPDVDLWQILTKNFDGKDLIPKPYEYLFGGTGEKILKRLDALNNTQPWLYYVHIMDLHRSVNFPLPESFNNEKFGKTDYEKMVSGIDHWLGKILEKIDLKKTLIIITSDHGEYIPISSINHEITYIPTLVHFAQKIKNTLPKTFHPFGFYVFLKIRGFFIPIRKLFLKSKLSADELRTLNIRGTKLGWELYDEVIRIPLLFSGFGISSNKIIEQQVRQIDIFPTILTLSGLSQNNKSYEGKDLAPLLVGNEMKEEPVLIENQLLDPNDNDIVMGLRTPKYKYFRDKFFPKKRVRLFDLTNDPGEKNNIAKERPEVVQMMEDLLVKYRKNETIIEEDSDQENILKIKDELKKLGYI